MSIHTKTILTVSGVLLGVVIGEYSRFATEIVVCALSLGIVQIVLHTIQNRNEQKIKETYSSPTVGFFSFSLLTFLICFGLVIGIIRVQFVQEKEIYTCATSCTISAVITSSPEIKNEYQVFSAQPIGQSDSLYDIEIKTALYPKYEIGESLILSGKITIPKVSQPHTGTKNDSKTFDYAQYLRTQNIGSEMLYPSIEIIDTEAHTLRPVLGRFKENIIHRIDSNIASPASSLASGVLLGASSISQELTQTFRVSGLSHIIVLSGFNIVIVISSILFVLGFLPLVIRVLLAGSSVIIFVLMVGGSPSVVRATIMALISLLALSLGRSYVAKQALILSLLFIIMYDPTSLTHDVSLHLSFLATAGLVYLSEPIGLLLQKYQFLTSKKIFFELLVTTLAAYISTLPYVMFTFGTVSVYALIANIIVVPFVPLAMLVSFLVVVCSYYSETLSMILGYVDTYLINLMIGVARLIEGLPFSTISISLTFTSMSICYIVIFLSMKYIQATQTNETTHRDINGNLSAVISY